MTDWPVKTLGEVAVVNPSEPALSEDAPFVPMDAVTAGKRDVQYTQPRGQRSGARARAGDILFARITPCLQNGKVALVQDEIARCGGSTEFIVVRAGPEVLNGYLYQWITSDHIRDEVTGLMKGATGRQRLNAEDLALAELPVPPLEEQKRIVTLLDAATERVTELTKCYEQARTHANNLFVSASREVFEGNPDWPVKTLGDVCEVLDSLRKPITKRDRTSGDYPYYGATGIVDYVGDYIFDERLVLVGEDGAKWDSGDRTAFIVEGRYWVNNHAHVLRCKQGVLVDSWLANFLTMSDLNRFVSGLTVPKLNQGSLVSIEIPVPPFEEQKRIVARLDSMRAKTSEMVAAYDAKLTAAKNLRQSILEAAFAGEL
jgi:restriction endonuclease S subunit